MNQRNYQKELEKIIAKLPECGVEKNEQPGGWNAGASCVAQPPTLLLHSCCAPCSSYCLEYLCRYFSITVFFYNPNISFSDEYQKRVEEQKRLIECYNAEKKGYPISMIEGDYDPGSFFEMAKGYETCPEGGERCFRCFDLRLRRTAMLAAALEGTAQTVCEAVTEAVTGDTEGKKKRYDYFSTTLTISPLKNAAKLNEIGESLAAEYGVAWLPSDFKKKNGYKRSVELSAEYGLYRQDYCGCAYSKAERMQGECWQ